MLQHLPSTSLLGPTAPSTLLDLQLRPAVVGFTTHTCLAPQAELQVERWGIIGLSPLSPHRWALSLPLSPGSTLSFINTLDKLGANSQPGLLLALKPKEMVCTPSPRLQ